MTSQENKTSNSVEDIDIKEFEKYEFILIFTLDKIILDKVETIKEKLSSLIKDNRFIEARLFDNNKEKFIYYNGYDFNVVDTNIDKENKNVIKRKYLLDKIKFKNCEFKKLLITEIVNYDEDGQAYIESSHLTGVL